MHFIFHHICNGKFYVNFFSMFIKLFFSKAPNCCFNRTYSFQMLIGFLWYWTFVTNVLSLLVGWTSKMSVTCTSCSCQQTSPIFSSTTHRIFNQTTHAEPQVTIIFTDNISLYFNYTGSVQDFFRRSHHGHIMVIFDMLWNFQHCFQHALNILHGFQHIFQYGS